MPEPKKHGGARPNAGRKPTGRKREFTSIQFPPSEIDMIDEIREHTQAKSRRFVIKPLLEKEYKKLKKLEKSS